MYNLLCCCRDDGNISLYSLILLITAICFQILIVILICGAMYAEWFSQVDCIYFYCIIGVPLLLLGCLLHLAAAILMIVSTAQQTEKGQIAFGGFIATLDFINIGLQLFFTIATSCAFGYIQEDYNEYNSI